MNDEQDIIRQAEQVGRGKFTWSGRPQRTRTPVVERLEWPDDYGPQICASCYGAGWMVDHARGGELVMCENCDKAANAKIARCWKVGSLKADAPKVPSIATFEPHNATAEAVLKAVGRFIRQPHGWLTLYGTPGTGKSHMAESITRYFLTTKVPALYTTSVNLWEYLGGVARGEHDATDYAERYRWVSDLPVLVIDELNVEKSTDFVFRTRRSLLDHRYRVATGGIGVGVTVLVSNDPPANWQDAAIGDRALDTRFVAIDTGTTSYRRIKRQGGQS